MPPQRGRATPEAASAKLRCLAGPSQGSEFPLSGSEAVVGRSRESAVCIPDSSVSRKHVLLRRLPDGWAASDMGSGNGTLVNGEPIDRETVLRNGDVIGIGDTELTFSSTERTTDRRPLAISRSESALSLRAARAPVRSSRHLRQREAADPAQQERRRKRLLWAGVASAVLVLSLVSIKLYQRHLGAEQEAIAAREKALRDRLEALFQEGRNLVRQGKWTEGREKFLEVQALNPSWPALQDLLDRAAKEIPNQQHLKLASDLLSQNKLGPAKLELDQVKEDTYQHEQYFSLRQRLEDRVGTRLTEARGLLDAGGAKDLGRMKQLEAITADLLAAVPDHRDALELNKQAKELIAEITRPVAPIRPEAPKPWLEVSSRFREGDLKGAYSLAQACAAKRVPQCARLPGQISSYQQTYQHLESLSPKQLQELFDLDERLSGGEGSKTSRNIGIRLGSHYFKSATAAKSAAEWGRAMDLAQKTLKVDPGHAGAQAMVQEFRRKAYETFQQGYSTRQNGDPEDALKLLKDVLALTAKGDELHVKAQKLIKQIENP